MIRVVGVSMKRLPDGCYHKTCSDQNVLSGTATGSMLYVRCREVTNCTKACAKTLRRDPAICLVVCPTKVLEIDKASPGVPKKDPDNYGTLR